MHALTQPLAVLALAAGLAAPACAADLKIGLITSMSGPVSALGVPYAKGMQVAHERTAEIAGHKVQVILLDDASDPTAAARNARKLVTEDKVDVLAGNSGVPGAMAIAAVARETKTPLISPTPLNVPADDGGWTVTFPAFTEAAGLEWRAWATVQALRVLRAYGRLG